jgi:hypothetical protein
VFSPLMIFRVPLYQLLPSTKDVSGVSGQIRVCSGENRVQALADALVSTIVVLLRSSSAPEIRNDLYRLDKHALNCDYHFKGLEVSCFIF